MTGTGKQALVVWGGWEGHEPQACAGIVAGMLRAAGFAVTVEHGTRAFADPALHGLDLIVPICTMMTIERAQLDNLCAAVEGGVGLGGYHGGMGDAFRAAPRYQFMCGGQWVAHPGDIVDYRVAVTGRTIRSWPASRTSTTARSSTTCTSTRRSRCSPPPPSRARTRPGPGAW